MFYSLKKIRGHRYLYIVDSKYDPEKKRTFQKNVKCLGRFDKLPKDVQEKFLDARAKKEMDQKLKQQSHIESLNTVGALPSQPDGQEIGESHFNYALALRYGHLALKGIWDKALGLKYKVDYIQKSATNISSWKLNDLLFYLCAQKVIDPQSYYKACETKTSYLYCPWADIVQDNFYRALDIVYDHKEELIQHAVKSHLSQTKTEVKVAFFDCTNTWFETPYDDVTWQIIRFTRRIKQDMAQAGCSEEDIELFLSGERFAEMLEEHLHSHEADVVRMRGKSKEGRFAQPIVTVALAIDQTGFPIDCKVFAGNMSEVRTIGPMLESLKSKYSVKDIYFVADRGLNSTEGLDAIQQEQLGFVVAQSVSRQKPAQRAEMLSLEGWRNCRMGEDGKFQMLSGEFDEKSFRCKVCDHTKSAMVETRDGAKTRTGRPRRRKLEINCRIIYTFCPKRRERDLAELETQIGRASRAVEDGALMGNPCGIGWRALIQTQKEAAADRDDREMYRAVGLKQDVIENRKAVAGYAAYVVSHPENPTHRLTDEEVLSTYHRLVNIEDCFRVMKSTFSIRPVHVRLRERITAHCYLCVLSLMMMRIVQEKLQAQGIELPAHRISKALEQAMVVPIPAANTSDYRFLNVGLLERFHSAAHTGKGKFEQGLNDTVDHAAVCSAFEASRLQRRRDTDLILQAVGLKPLKIVSSLSELKNRLNVKSASDRTMIAAEQLEQLKKASAAL